MNYTKEELEAILPDGWIVHEDDGELFICTDDYERMLKPRWPAKKLIEWFIDDALAYGKAVGRQEILGLQRLHLGIDAALQPLLDRIEKLEGHR